MGTQPHRVVVLGGGFGGLYVARGLRSADVQVTLIDKRNFHLFQPLLYQVATGGLSPGDIAEPLRSIFASQKNTRVLLAVVSGWDVARKRVILTDGECEYDTLVVALGSQTSYFGKDEQWKPYAPGLKTIEEATEIRQRIFFAFEEAEKATDPAARAAWLTFIVVGAGPTGVELAGTLGEISRDTLRNDFRQIHPEEACILLVDGNGRVLSNYPEDLSRKAEHELIDLGVQFRPEVRVTNVDDDGVLLKTARGEERIIARTVLWAAGVVAHPLGRDLAAQTGAEVDKPGHIKVDEHCNIPGHPEIFVIGDLAGAVDSAGKPLPGVAPVAIQMGQYVAKRIRARLAGQDTAPFHYWNKGSLATIGRKKGVADFGRIHFGGFLAWAMWLFVHLFYLVGFSNRILVFLQWGIQYVSYNRGARLITGATRMIEKKAMKESSTTTNA